MPKLYLSKKALIHNYRLLKGTCAGLLIPVLKADAYGHGALFAFDALLDEGASLFAVATAYEALELLNYIEKSKYSFTKSQILVMGPVEAEALPALLSPRVLFSIHSPHYARALSNTVAEHKARFLLPERFSLSVHLKLETGMHRLGLRTESALRAVASLPHITVTGAYSHLGRAADLTRTEGQRQRFFSLRASLPEKVLTHLSASEGLLRYGDLGCDASRVGLSLYGVAPEGAEAPLLPVMRFSARVLSVFTAEAGEWIGYGDIRTETRRRLAVIDAGYADGIPPNAGEGGYAVIKGKPCPFFGAVCMDRSTLDIGALPLHEGEEILLFGDTAGDTARFAAACHISPYALLTHRSLRTARILL